MAGSFDTGDRIVVRYARVASVSARPIARAASSTTRDPMLLGGPVSFAAYVREVLATGTTVAPYLVESFESAPPIGQAQPPAQPAPAPAAPAAQPPTAAQQPAAAPPSAAPQPNLPQICFPLLPGTTAVPSVPAAAPSTPGAEPTAEEKLRSQWAFMDQLSVAQAMCEASPDELQDLQSLRAGAGQAPAPTPSPSPLRASQPQPAPQAVPQPTAAPTQPPAAEMSNRHQIFDRMADSLAYATTFDVGDVALGRRFDEMNSRLDRESAAAARLRVGNREASAGMSLDDRSLMADLESLRTLLTTAPDTAGVTAAPAAGPATAPTTPEPIPGQPPAPLQPVPAAPAAAAPATPAAAAPVTPAPTAAAPAVPVPGAAASPAAAPVVGVPASSEPAVCHPPVPAA